MAQNLLFISLIIKMSKTKVGFTSEILNKQDLTFSSSAEIASYIKANRGGPSSTLQGSDIE